MRFFNGTYLGNSYHAAVCRAEFDRDGNTAYMVDLTVFNKTTGEYIDSCERLVYIAGSYRAAIRRVIAELKEEQADV